MARASTRSARPATRATRRVAAALRPTDPALLHYRSGAFYCARAAQAPARPTRVARRAARRGRRPPTNRSPAAGTRSSATPTCDHPDRPRRSPRTCPARSGSAFAIERRAPARLGPSPGARGRARRRRRSCSFGDASVNHASAAAAFNTAGWCDHQRAARCRCCSSARTTAWASACASPRGLGRGHAAQPAAAPLLRRRRLRPGRRRTTWPPRRPPGAPRTAAPPCCTCRTVRLMGHAGRRRRGRPTARAAEIAGRPGARPAASRTARLLVEAGLATAGRAAGPLRRDRLAGPQVAEEVLARAEADRGRRGRSRRSPRAGPGRSRRPGRRRPRPGRGAPAPRPSAASCPSARAR